MAKKKRIARRDFLVLSGLASAGTILAACKPQVVEKIVKETVIVEKEKLVKETVVVKEAVAVEKEVTRVVEKEKEKIVEKEVTRVVEKEKIVEKIKEVGIRNVTREQTVVFYFGGGGGTWASAGICNPYATGFTHQNGEAACLEPLEYYFAFSDEFHPWTAEDHSFSADNKTLTIKIRKGVEWSDGEPFTAEDVAFTLNMLIKHAPKLGNSARVKEWVEEAKAVDDYTCVIKFFTPQPRFYFDYLTFKFDTGIKIIPEHIFKDVDDPTAFKFFDPDKGWPVVTGSYNYTYFTTTQKFLDRRDDWWAAKIGFKPLPEPERILCLPMVDDTMAAQLAINNTLDACLDLRPATIKTIVEQNPKVITHSMQKPPYGYVDWWPNNIGFNDLEEPFSNPDIRWAVSYAIDRQQAIDVAYGKDCGTPNVLFLPTYKPLMPFLDALSDLFEKYPTNEYNLEKSAALMEKNGYTKDSEGFWEKDGKRFAFGLGGWQIYADIGPVLAEMLRKGGFEVDFNMAADHWQRVSVGETYYAYLVGHGGSVGPDPFLSCDLYNGRRIKPTGEAGGIHWRWNNEAYTAIIDEMASVPMGDPKVMELWRKAMEIWLRELPSIPFIQWYHRIPMNLTYWTGWPTEEDPYLNGAPWHLTWPRVIDRLKAVK